MKIYISTPVSQRSEPTFAAKWEAARLHIEELKPFLAKKKRFKTDAQKHGLPEELEFTSAFMHGLDESLSEAETMGRCVTDILNADALYLDGGWRKGRGCRLEYRAAQIYRKLIYWDEDL